MQFWSLEASCQIINFDDNLCCCSTSHCRLYGLVNHKLYVTRGIRKIWAIYLKSVHRICTIVNSANGIHSGESGSIQEFVTTAASNLTVWLFKGRGKGDDIISTSRAVSGKWKSANDLSLRNGFNVAEVLELVAHFDESVSRICERAARDSELVASEFWARARLEIGDLKDHSEQFIR